jgi:uncharacterized repeat protein (TIGR03803 family)
MTQARSFSQVVRYPILALPMLLAVIASLPMTATVAQAQQFTVLYSFCSQAGCLDGQFPQAPIQATDGNFYGTTQFGGGNDCDSGCGTIFKVTPGGALTTLHRFCALPNCADGFLPGVLIQAASGDFYGTTNLGGTNGGGTVFRMTPNGELVTLYSFCSQANCADGADPMSGVMQASDGDFYGTTSSRGAHDGGTIFKITARGDLTTLYSFCSLPNCADGSYAEGALFQATDGNIYGETYNGGIVAYGGTIFKLTPSGTLTTVYSFCSIDAPSCLDGYKPASLIQAADGEFYGTTGAGGVSFTRISGNGTFFKLTPSGELTTLYSFCSDHVYPDCPHGDEAGGLIQLMNGNFYGVTQEGGTGDSDGTIFEMTPSGELKTVFDFCDGPTCTGVYSYNPSGLLLSTDGNFYGTTFSGGIVCSGEPCYYGGSFFRLEAGLSPFVALRTSAGPIGATVIILGDGLTGAGTVAFNGTPATFTVNLTGTAITASVPTGATSGTVTVSTHAGVLSSNKPFVVWQ